MRRVCMYCKTELEPKEPLEDERISHTVCEGCIPRAMNDAGVIVDEMD
jgi:hypothetical protein